MNPDSSDSGSPESDGQQEAPQQTTPELAAGSNLPAFPKIISFDSLARCGDEIWIENGGQIYRLQRTRLGKLILTK